MSVRAFAAVLVLAPFAAHAGEATKIAQGYADAANRQSAVVKCRVYPEARQNACMVAEGVSARSVARFADGLSAVARNRGLPDGWTVTLVHQE